jgi:dipeptidase E
MRLYLSSFGLGICPERLVGLVKGNYRTAVILNAYDHHPEPSRLVRHSKEVAALESLGFSTFELDLRHYFGNRDEGSNLASVLDGCGLVWVRGGNTFVLRRAMRASGFDRLITALLKQDALVYGGYSAGVSVLTPSLRGVELVDDPIVEPAGYKPGLIWEGLGILPYAVAPHYRCSHPESDDAGRYVQYCIDHHLLFKALTDGEVIVIDGELDEVVGLTS